MLWIVCQVDALIAKVAANLENTVEATNDKPGLYGDNRIDFGGRDPRVKRNAMPAMLIALPDLRNGKQPSDPVIATSFLCLKFPKSHS